MANPFSVVPSLDSARVTREDSLRSWRRIDLLEADILGLASEESCPLHDGVSEQSSEYRRNLVNSETVSNECPSWLTFGSAHFESRRTYQVHAVQSERHCWTGDDARAMNAWEQPISIDVDGRERSGVLNDGEQVQGRTKKKSLASRLVSMVLTVIPNRRNNKIGPSTPKDDVYHVP
eukprot:TRINITY_DN14643_c0_g1_i1.p1 TRINITY_DN14643_c0_g1~~TRINITY_DN14643_c0_g1_i1.p1  ORF type:complete len:199 (-),score=19.12 TRINITY_DN14643_c0_g1_i1:42-572(-)